jgi:hypothetical protein
VFFYSQPQCFEHLTTIHFFGLAMDISSLPIANCDNPKSAYGKIYEWVLRLGSPTVLSSSCENPILMNYQHLRNCNCWVTICYDRLFNAFHIAVTSGVTTPIDKQPKIIQFLNVIVEKSQSPLEFDPSDKAVWTTQSIELTDTELHESEIEMAFNRACKAIDDSAAPILSIIYGDMTVQEAVAAYEKAQALSLTDWWSSFRS